ncbi:MAG: hypothetical protein M1818_004388 [Claussenomyces sp. TS43310]|nr:MAG: hypothetical protein M1818_004388 [Claussenomyces sp. TS43310]
MKRMFNIAILASLLTTIFAQLASSQLVASLPDCVQTCINQSGDDNCEASDPTCLCRASNGNFLPDLIICMHSECDDAMDTNLLLIPLQYACIQAGAPIATAAILNAEQEASSLAAQPATVTVTESARGSRPTSAIPQLTTLTSTSTTTAVDVSGSTIIVVYPETFTQSVTVTTASTTSAPGKSVTRAIPLIIVGTDGAGSIYTSTTLEPDSVTVTATDSTGSPQTVTSTITDAATSLTSTQTRTMTNSATSSRNSGSAGVAGSGTSRTGGGESTDASGTTTLTATVAAQSTMGSTSSSVPGVSKTKQVPNSDETDSPFGMQSAAGRRTPTSRLGLGVFLVVLVMWI